MGGDMVKPYFRINIGTLLNVCIGLVFILAAVVIIVLVNHNMRRQALVEAESKARILLDRNMATHTYFSQIMKPKLFEWTAPFRTNEFFEPSWMSSTFALREIDKYFRSFSPADYDIKDAAINARSPENEAGNYEKGFVAELNANPKLEARSGIRMIAGQPYFVVLRKGEVMEESCLRCHGNPKDAPKGLVKFYGPERSFYRKVGDIASVVSIRIPLAAAYAEADRFSIKLSALLLGVLALLFLVQFGLYRRFLLSPLGVIRDKAHQISSDNAHLGEDVPALPGREFKELTTAFNTMSTNLRQSRDQLEQRVKERTAELKVVIDQLEQEIEERKRTEAEKEKLIGELQETVAKVKTLSGMLPICASCKKIRDDKGYWTQIESYIRDHSEAEFSHSLCPECMKRLYPDEI